MLRRLWRALLGPPYTPPPRLRAVIEQLDALEGSVNGLRKRVKTLEGQISGGERGNGHRETPDDAPGRTIEEEPDRQYPPTRRPTSTEHLARRFRIGG